MGTSTEELTMREREIAATRDSLSRDFDELTDKVSPRRVAQRRTAAAKSRLGSMRDKVMGTASDVQHHASSAGGSMSDSVNDAAQSAVDTAQSAVGGVQARTEGNPLLAGAVAFGAGMLLSSLLPASRHETEAARHAVDAAKDSGLVDEAKSAGMEMKDHLQDSAQQAAEELKSTAADSAQHVKEEGRSSAETVKSETSG